MRRAAAFAAAGLLLAAPGAAHEGVGPRDACPLLTAKLALIQRRLAGAEGVRLVSISVDPTRDVPAVLARYAEGFGARPERWVFLTGKAAEVKAVLDAFGVTVRPGPGGSLDHTMVTLLVDRQGRRRFSYFGLDFDEAHVEADAGALLDEK